MAAIILVWNPRLWNAWNYDSVIEQVAETGQFLDRWSVARHRNIQPGTQAWLLLQGPDQTGRGLIGHGVVMSETHAAQSTDPGSTLRYVNIAFDALLPLGDQIPTSILASEAPGVVWNRVRGSGRAIPQVWNPTFNACGASMGPRRQTRSRLCPEPTLMKPSAVLK